MSRALNGSLRGRAASVDLADQMDELYAARERAQRVFTARWRVALGMLQQLDPEWERWYDDRPEQTAGDMLPVIEARVRELSAVPA